MDDILDKEQNQNKKRGFNTKIILYIGFSLLFIYVFLSYFYDLRYRWLMYSGLGLGIFADILKYYFKYRKRS